MVKILSIYKIPNGNILERVDTFPFNSFFDACIEERNFQTTSEEKEKIIQVLLSYCKGRISEDRMSFATFSFATSSELVLKCALQKYIDLQTFGIHMIFEIAQQALKLKLCQLKLGIY